jgi:hypothetical protein
MSRTIDARANRPDRVAKTEAGAQAATVRDDRSVAELASLDDAVERCEVVATIREERRRYQPVTLDEILDWKNEGRR